MINPIMSRGRGRGGPPPWAGGGGGRGWGRGGGAPPFMGVSQPQIPAPPPNVLRVIVSTLDDRGIEAQISPRFARAPFITVVDIVDGRVVQASSMPNSFMNMPHGVGVAMAQWIISTGAKAVIGVNFGPNLAMVLQQAGIRMYTVAPGIRVIDALRSLGLVRM